MLPRTHIILGAIFSLVVYLIFPELGWNALIIFAASFLVDLDHYFVAVIMTKNLHPIKAYRYFMEHEKNDFSELKYKLYIFHTFEFYILLFILSLSYQILLLVLGGVAFHILLDAFNKREKHHKSILSYLIKKK